MFPSAGNIIFGILGMGGGYWLMTHAYYMNKQIYFLEFFERRYGPGSGTIAYRFIGLGLLIFSMFVITGWIDLFPAGPQPTQQDTQSIIPSGSTSPIQIAP